MKLKTSSIKPFGSLLEPTHPYDNISSFDIDDLRQLLFREHLIVLRGFHTFETVDELTSYCARWGEISLWPFGKVLELVEQKYPKDHIFDSNYVPLHWDGMYRPQVPELQIFQCVSAPKNTQGGRTTFSNSATAVDNLTASTRELLGRTTGIYQRKMEFYDSKTIAPIISKHPTRNFEVIRYCEPPSKEDNTFVNHPTIKFEGIEKSEVNDLHSSLREILYAPENFYAHTWQTDDIVISDNYTLLHGREAFTPGALRHLRRVHILGELPLNNPHLVSSI